MITAGPQGPIVVWDAVTGLETITLEGHKKGVVVLVAAPGLRIYSAGLDGTVKLWEGLEPGPLPDPRKAGKRPKFRRSR